MSETILAVGADGKCAGLVIPALAARGAKVRGLVRKPEATDSVLRLAASEVAIGDLNDRASIDRALDGVKSVFYIAPAFIPDEANVDGAMVNAAIKAGVLSAPSAAKASVSAIS